MLRAYLRDSWECTGIVQTAENSERRDKETKSHLEITGVSKE